MKAEETIHPSYGMISFSRINSNANNHFFGSDLPTGDYIQMEIKQGGVENTLSSQRFFAENRKNVLARVVMTPNQFAELITRMNVGDGIPCTVEVIDGKHVEKAPKIENRKMFTQRKFQERLQEFAKGLSDNMQRVATIMKKATFSKQDKEDILRNQQWMAQEITKNLPFFAECFQETMDKVVLDAKQQIDAALMGRIVNLGLEALAKENENLLGGPQEI